MTKKAFALATLVYLGGVFWPASAWPQSAAGSIAGVVRDTTGAILPGVTVEAASPALIEKVRTVTTDEAGRYSIVDLRPGSYSVTFTLPGFSAVKREGIELTTGFTASINAEMRIGAIEETLTVTAASPVVDVANVRTQNVLTSEELHVLPTGKMLHSWAALTLGASVVGGGGQDVGGNRGENAASMAVQGGRNVDQRLAINGMTYNMPSGNGGGLIRVFVPNEMFVQEITLETSGQTAESESAGVQINLVTKEGGNAFSGSVGAAYTGPNLQSDNITDAVRARGLSATPGVKNIYDLGFGIGGPIRTDRMWFFSAVRKWGSGEYSPGNYFNKTPHSFFYTPDLSRPASQHTKNLDFSGRVTWQVSSTHKLSIQESFQDLCACYRSLEQNQSPEATINNIYFPVSLTQVTWSHPATNRLLLQSGVTYSYNPNAYHRVEGVTADDIPITELSTGYRYGAAAGAAYFDPNGPTGKRGTVRRHVDTQFTVSYVTGSHTFRTGGTYYLGGAISNFTTQNDGVSYSVRKSTPDALPNPVSITYYSNPNYSETMSEKASVFAQDQWKLSNLTLNLGLRFDYLHAWAPAQTKPAGVWVPARNFEKVDDVPNWKDVLPRVGMAYDLFGNSKTAIKVSVGRYVQLEMASVASANSSANAIVSSATRTWGDSNRDFIPQETELGPLSNSAFGTVAINTRWSDDVLKGWSIRPYNWTTTASLQQELAPNLGLTLNYYRRWYGNFRVTQNLATSPDQYDPFCITAPTDSRLGPVSGTQQCGFYNIKPSVFGRVDNLVTSASHFGNQTEVYNGFDTSLNGRFRKGGQFSAGVSTGQTITDSCFVVNSPQDLRFCHLTYPFEGQTQIKATAAYPLPWDMMVSAVLQSLSGVPITPNPNNNGLTFGVPLAGGTYAAPNAAIVPTLGRDLAACRPGVACTATVSLNLVEPYAGFEDRLNQLDLRLTKMVRLGPLRVQGKLDLYNVFNASTVINQITQVGPRYLQPTQILPGRLLKVGVELDF